jgi:MoaA/NifB/PqqE/SkfB family radical SAM enzyme
MAATLHGDGVWGISADETGIITHNIDHNFTSDVKTLRNRTGEEIGASYYNEYVDITIDGAIPTTSAITSKIGAELTLTNALVNHLQQGVGGTVVIGTINRKRANEDYEMISLNAKLYPYIT